MNFPLKPPFIGGFPLLCLITVTLYRLGVQVNPAVGCQHLDISKYIGEQTIISHANSQTKLRTPIWLSVEAHPHIYIYIICMIYIYDMIPLFPYEFICPGRSVKHLCASWKNIYIFYNGNIYISG